MRDDAAADGKRATSGSGSGESLDGRAILLLFDQKAWETWLDRNHSASTGVWLKIAKRGTGAKSVGYAEAVESAMCFGWIDAKKQKYDDSFFLQMFSPRRAGSIWSKLNREKALALIDAGRMSPAGLRAVEEAQNNGRWAAAYEPASSAEIPSDFQSLLDANPRARAFFETLRGANRYAVLHRIQTARKPETREKRMAAFIEMLARHETIHSDSR